MRRVRLSAAARSDMAQIARSSSSMWGEEQRSKYITRIRERLEQLCGRPELGPVYDARRPGLRRLTVGAHIAFYRFDDARILVVRILDQRMDLESRLGQPISDD
jgi:toxin ParE1/3/4